MESKALEVGEEFASYEPIYGYSSLAMPNEGSRANSSLPETTDYQRQGSQGRGISEFSELPPNLSRNNSSAGFPFGT